MAILNNDNIKTLAPKPTDSRYFNDLNPYVSEAEANSIITTGNRYQGLTVSINGVEYWYKDGTDDVDLVQKESNIATVGITGATNGLIKNGQNVELGGTLTGNTVITTNSNTFEIGNTTNGNGLCFNPSDSMGFIITDGVNLSGIRNHMNGMNEIGVGSLDYENFSGIHYSLSPNPLLSIGVKSGATGNSFINMYTNELIIGNNDFNNFEGVKYPHNYRNNFVCNSLVDAAYVTGLTSTSGVQTANNGLTRTGNNIQLGGEISSPVTLSGSGAFEITAPTKISNVETITYQTNPTITGHIEGRTYFNDGTLNVETNVTGVKIQVGEEQLVKVYNLSGAQIPNGSVVYVNGSYSNLATIEKADASQINGIRAIGLVTADINHNDSGYVTTNGLVRDLDTSSFAAGDILYVSDTVAGEFVNIKPTYPSVGVRIGSVTKIGVTDGEILVDVRCETDFVTQGTFTGYTATTQNNLDNKLDKSIYSSYTGSTNGRLDNVEAVTDIAITGITNGLTKVGNHNGRLGGNLTQGTTILGNGNSMGINNINGLTLSTSGTSDLHINSKDGGGLYMKAQNAGGSVTTPNSFTNSIGIAMDYDLSMFSIIDNRSGNAQKGIMYGDDYSPNYDDRSLVDKAYVDSIATGLSAKKAVDVATTSGITLSGLQTIDGVLLVDGNRVLVKDQNDATENGVYVASGGTWVRAEDSNFNPTGEIANGDLIPVLSGDTNISTQWILTTQDPIVSGTSELIYSKFSQLLEIAGGSGINITTVAGVRTIGVDLGTNSGLVLSGDKLLLDYTTFGLGLTAGAGSIDLNVSDVIPTGTEVLVKVDTNGNDVLYIDSDDISSAIGTPVISTNNGLTKDGNNVRLGGTLTGSTTIFGDSGAHDFNLNSLNSFNLGFDNISTITDSGTNGGIRYADDYSPNYVDRSLVDKAFVIDSITGSTLTFQNGLTKTNDTIELGGSLDVDKSISRCTASLNFQNGSGGSISMITANSDFCIQDDLVYLRSCNTAGSITGQVQINETGLIEISTNNTTQGITVTDTGSQRGIVYGGDYRSTFIDESLVDKKYVDDLVSTGGTITGGTNGVSAVGKNIELGGALTSDRLIDLGNFNLTITGTSGSSTVNMSCLTYLDGNEGEGRILASKANGEAYWAETIESELLTGATNGITKVGDIVRLGGILTGSTIIIDNRATKVGIEYGDDYSPTYTSRSLVDADYVTGLTSAIAGNIDYPVTGATNGLTLNGKNVELGGEILKNTIISTTNNNDYSVKVSGNSKIQLYDDDGYNSGVLVTTASTKIFKGDSSFIIDGNDVNISVLDEVFISADNSIRLQNSTNDRIIIGVDDVDVESDKNVNITAPSGVTLQSTPDTGTISDSVLVWNSTDKKIKTVSGDLLGENNNNYDKTVITTNTTLTTGSTYVILVNNIGSSPITITLPATPKDGQVFRIKDAGNNALTYNIIIARNGNNIDGVASNALINTDGGAVEIVYDMTLGWFVFSFVN